MVLKVVVGGLATGSTHTPFGRPHRPNAPFFMQNLQVGQLIPNFLEAERVKLFALGILDVSEGAFGGGDFREIVQKRIEQFGRDRVFIGNGFVANLLDGLEFRVLQDFGEDALFVRVGNEG